ncbi:MAG: hypothetical protein RJA98_1831 [Pseudomonadota bacterium]|jgi:DNA-binding transcriptional LysR family regulator
MRTIDLDSLEIFRAVVREGGVVRAAAQLHRVQSNITTRVKQLEQRLGVSLFRRHGRNLVLTPSGQSLLVHAEKLLRLADEAEDAMRATPARGILRLGSMESTAGSRLPALLASFHRKWPDIHVELQTGTTEAMTRKVAAYELDAAFVGEPFSGASLLSRPMFQEELVLITAKQHAPVNDAADVESATVLAFSQGCSYRKRLIEWFAQSALNPGRILELASYQAMIACAAVGTGFAIVPVSLLNTMGVSKNVKRHKLPDAIGRNRTLLIWSNEPSSTLRLFLDEMPLAV